jgi:hypothetical protein
METRGGGATGGLGGGANGDTGGGATGGLGGGANGDTGGGATGDTGGGADGGTGAGTGGLESGPRRETPETLPGPTRGGIGSDNDPSVCAAASWAMTDIAVSTMTEDSVLDFAFSSFDRFAGDGFATPPRKSFNRNGMLLLFLLLLKDTPGCFLVFFAGRDATSDLISQFPGFGHPSTNFFICSNSAFLFFEIFILQ